MIAKLAESNPVVKALMDRFSSMEQTLKETEARAQLAETTRRLSDLTNGKKVQRRFLQT